MGARGRTVEDPADCLDGWLLVIDWPESGIDPIAVGWLALAQPKDGVRSIRRVIRMTGSEIVLMRAIGRNEEVAVNARVASPVVAMLP